MYLDRIAPLLPGKSGVDAPLFRSEEAFWEAVERERARTLPLVVLLDEQGRRWDQKHLPPGWGANATGGRQLLVFTIGPADGWSAESRKRGICFCRWGR